MDEEKLAKQIVCSSAGTVQDAENSLNLLVQGLKKINETKDICMPVKEFVSYVHNYYKRLSTKTRFKNFFQTALNTYLLNNTKKHATNKMLQDNYEIHANLSSKTADSIIEAADSIIETASDVIESITSTKGEETQEYESDDSYKSENYHPRRIRKYSVRNLYEDVVEVN